MTDGSVKPIHERIPPNIPPLNKPIDMPTWDDAGPGKN